MVSRIRSRVNIEIETDSLTFEALRRSLLRFGRRIRGPRRGVVQSGYRLREQGAGNASREALARDESPRAEDSLRASDLNVSRLENALPQSVGDSSNQHLNRENGAQTPQWRKLVTRGSSKVFPGYS